MQNEIRLRQLFNCLAYLSQALWQVAVYGSGADRPAEPAVSYAMHCQNKCLSTQIKGMTFFFFTGHVSLPRCGLDPEQVRANRCEVAAKLICAFNSVKDGHPGQGQVDMIDERKDVFDPNRIIERHRAATLHIIEANR